MDTVSVVTPAFLTPGGAIIQGYVRPYPGVGFQPIVEVRHAGDAAEHPVRIFYPLHSDPRYALMFLTLYLLRRVPHVHDADDEAL